MSQSPLLQDVLANPYDDEARLIYADWLMERGNRQGEFIQVQCELARLQQQHAPKLNDTDLHEPHPKNDASYNEQLRKLRSRELQLIRRHSKGWARSIRKFAKHWTYDRGLVSTIRIDAATYLRKCDDIFASNPLTGVEFTNFQDSELVHEVESHKQLEQLRYIGAVSGTVVVNHGNTFSRFLSSPRLANLRELLIHNHVPTNLMIDSIRNSLAHLEKLSIAGSWLVYSDLERIVQVAKRLKSLSIQNAVNFDFRDRGRPRSERIPAALGPALLTLQELEITQGSGLTWNGLLRLGEYPTKQLKKLHLGEIRELDGFECSDEQWKSLFDGFLFRYVEDFRLHWTHLSSEKFEWLVGCASASRWRRFEFNNSEFTPNHARSIARSNCLQNLIWLELNSNSDNSNGILAKGASAILSSENFTLQNLSLRNQGIDNDVIPALLNSPSLQTLYRLDLSNNKIDDNGIQRICRYGYWPSLVALNLRYNPISKASKNLLRKTFDWRVIF